MSKTSGMTLINDYISHFLKWGLFKVKIKNMILISSCLFLLAILVILISYINMNRYNIAARELADSRFFSSF